MSSLHCNTNWPAIQKELSSQYVEIGKELAGRAYSPKAQNFTFALQCHSGFYDLFIADLKSTAQKRLAENQIDRDTAIGFPLEKIQRNIEVYAEYCKQIALSLPLDKREGKSDGKDATTKGCSDPKVATRFGLTSAQQINAINKTKEIFLECCTKMCTTYQGRTLLLFTAPTILDVKFPLGFDLQNFFYRKSGLRSSKDPVSFSKQELEYFGIQQNEQVKNPQKLNCAEFALLKTGELQAKEQIFKTDFLPKDWSPTLKSWGYRPVTKPNENDLVMYLNDEGPTHLGRYLESGKIESKLGGEQPYFHWHDLFDVPAHYGKQVVFWRKNRFTFGSD